jgi:hypothetical protein
VPFRLESPCEYEGKEEANMADRKSGSFLRSIPLLRAFLIYFSALLVLISLGAFLLNAHTWPLFVSMFSAWMLILKAFFRSSK